MTPAAEVHRRGEENWSSIGARLKAWYLVLGQCDFVTIWEAPNDEPIATLNLAIGSSGNVTTATLRAFTEDEFRNIVAALL